MPQADVANVEHQLQEDHSGVAAEVEQPMDRNCALGSGFKDSISLVEGLWLPDPRRRHGDVGREVRGG